MISEVLKQAIANRLASRGTIPTGGTRGRSAVPAGNPNDPRGPVGIFARGENIYNGGSRAAQRGGPNIGRPSNPGGNGAAIARRLRR